MCVEIQIRGSFGVALDERLHHTPAGREEPAVGASAEDGGGVLGHDEDAQGVWEVPVVARAHDCRERVHLGQYGRTVEADERLPDECRERRVHLACHLTRAAAHLDPVDGEERRLPRNQVAAEGEPQYTEPDCERAPRRRETSEPGPRMHVRPRR